MLLFFGLTSYPAEIAYFKGELQAKIFFLKNTSNEVLGTIEEEVKSKRMARAQDLIGFFPQSGQSLGVTSV